ncbi:EamA family transporter [Candidatus Woesearchaeota archaeon]|nr:EamA family transporter [Candidatus Woesearchaeota archaeon]MCF8013492.1 EamA family transporter [Candidatus Woesearchaeota archaeon]
MKKEKIGILLFFLSSLIAAVSQILLKMGALKTNSEIFSYLNIYIFISLLLYGASTLLIIIALNYGEVSKLYSLMSLSYVFVVIFATIFLFEIISLKDFIGIFVILLGVIIINKERYK